MTYEDFQKYDAENPQVWEMFVKFTFEAIRAGRKRFSSELIINVIRWETQLRGNDEFKVNNDLKPFFARKFHQEYPEHQGFFSTRISKADDLGVSEKEDEMSDSTSYYEGNQQSADRECKKCKMPIMMLLHKKSGNAAPIEANPSENGNVLVNPEKTHYRIATNEERTKAKAIGHPLYLNHFASCEFAKSFAKK
jgi:hypothetical protein